MTLRSLLFWFHPPVGQVYIECLRSVLRVLSTSLDLGPYAWSMEETDEEQPSR